MFWRSFLSQLHVLISQNIIIFDHLFSCATYPSSGECIIWNQGLNLSDEIYYWEEKQSMEGSVLTDQFLKE